MIHKLIELKEEIGKPLSIIKDLNIPFLVIYRRGRKPVST